MDKYLVVVTDGARARFFRLEDADMPELESGPDLVEKTARNNPELELHGEDVFSTTKSGSNRSTGNGKFHGYDDHRSAHFQESQKRFAHQVAQDISTQLSEQKAEELILAASPSMLGHIRTHLKDVKHKDITIHEVSKDMAKMKPRDIHKNLAKDNLLPERRTVHL